MVLFASLAYISSLGLICAPKTLGIKLQPMVGTWVSVIEIMITGDSNHEHSTTSTITMVFIG